MKNDALKKHHFWILFGLVPLFIFIGVLVVGSSVGGAIAAREAKISSAEKNIKAKSNPKPNVLLDKMDELITKVKSKQDGLWTECFYPQKTVYSADAMLAQVSDLDARRSFAKLLRPVEKLKYGDPKIPDAEGQFDLFRRSEIYDDWYDNLAKRVKPTTFAGGWRSVFRHVNTWPQAKLSYQQVWLLLEDMWVQKSLMEAVGSINEDMAEFKRVKFERDGQVIDDPDAASSNPKHPLRRKFRNRVWEVELEVVNDGPKQYLKGALVNITDKLQLLGVGNNLTLKVWLTPGDRETVTPFEFKIGGELVPGTGGGTKVVVMKDKDGNVLKDKDGKAQTVTIPTNRYEVERAGDHNIPAGMIVSEIVRVEQVFDARTVPIHLIKALALGKADSRNAGIPLKQHPMFGADESAADAGGKPSGPGAMGSAPGPAAGAQGGGAKGLGSGPASFAGPSGPGGQKTSEPQLGGGGPVEAVLDAAKKRYVDITDQVRRFPVAVRVVVDQSNLQDVLLAFANSPLRFQITQVTWDRFRGTLDLGGSGGSSSEAGGGVVYSGQASFGQEFGKMGSIRPPGGLFPGPRPIGPGPMGGPGMPGFPGMPGYGGGHASTVSESQLTSGLIELTVYGIVSLYTSPEAAAAEALKKDESSGKTDPKKDIDPKKDAPKDKGKDKEPDPKAAPMPPAANGTNPKKG